MRGPPALPGGGFATLRENSLKRRYIAATVALAAGILAVSTTATAQATGTWKDRAAAALTEWHKLDDAKPSAASAFSLSYAGLAEATLNGWSDPAVQTLLDRTMALRNPDGGWGLNATTNALDHAHVRAADTTFTVTLADHVGPFLLGAYQHGLIGVEPLQTIGSLLVHMKRWTWYGGVCLAYSESPYDQVNPNECVHNANAAAGLFLTQLSQAGIGIPGASSVRALILKCEIGTFTFANKNWKYSEIYGTLQDLDHAALNTEHLLAEAPTIGYVPMVQIMQNASTNPVDRLAHFRLGSFYCAAANQWFGEFDDWLTTPPADASTRLAQMARWGARDYQVCEAS
jgi:hypothetical protein